jgi:DNA-binding response OmpR family regulator
MTERTHILVVEDDPLVSEVIAAGLEDRFQTSVVETAADALQVLDRGDVDLMLLDCSLPGGLDPALLPAADRLGAPVILMSGDHTRIEGISGRQPRPFVLKPFTLTSLIETVDQVLRAG